VPLFASIRAIRDPFSFVCLVFFVVKKFWLPRRFRKGRGGFAALGVLVFIRGSTSFPVCYPPATKIMRILPQEIPARHSRNQRFKPRKTPNTRNNKCPQNTLNHAKGVPIKIWSKSFFALFRVFRGQKKVLV
jgi:hypothetical protein